MSMGAFLFAADALRIEEGWGFHVETPDGRSMPVEADVRARNAESMAALSGMLAGVRGAPRVKR